MAETISDRPEKREGITDDARTFTVEDISPQLLDGDGVVSFRLVIDWLDTGEDEEEKVVLKEFPDGKVQRFSVRKETRNGKRTTVKTEISEEEYNEKKSEALTTGIGIKKIRHEFPFEQGGVIFEAKYDELIGENNLRILEVDAGTDEARTSFDPATFPAASLVEVHDRSYEGYRIADKV